MGDPGVVRPLHVKKKSYKRWALNMAAFHVSCRPFEISGSASELGILCFNGMSGISIVSFQAVKNCYRWLVKHHLFAGATVLREF